MQKFPYKSVQSHFKQLLSDVRKKDTQLFNVFFTICYLQSL